jgi:hypothetical protein
VELAPSVEPLAFLWQRALSELVELAPSVEPLAFLWQRALSQFAIELAQSVTADFQPVFFLPRAWLLELDCLHLVHVHC